MKVTKKIVLLLLVFAMLLPCALAGCKEKPQDDPEDSSAESSETTETGDNNGGDNTTAPELKGVTIYPEFDTRINRDYMYSVSVARGDASASIPVYNHATDDALIRNQSDKAANAYRRFSTFAFDEATVAELGKVRVDIKVNKSFNKYSVLPAAKNFETSYADGVISVYLDKPEYFNIRLDGKDSSILAVFADAPEVVPDLTDRNVKVVEGWETIPSGVYTMSAANKTLYIKPGAVFNARIKITAKNCKVIGRGIILDPTSNMYNGIDASKVGKDGAIMIKDTKGSIVDGVHILNAFGFNITVQGNYGSSTTYAEDTSVTNVKILSTQMCSDGITFGYLNKDSYAENCYIYCGDNGIVVESGATYKNIMIGTTCNAIFPQSKVTDTSLEDIYVFRADEGLINQDYTADGVTRIDYTVKNVYANDITYMPYALRVEYQQIKSNVSGAAYNPVNGGAKIENLYLPALSSVAANNFYSNTDNKSQTVNASYGYLFTVKNISVDGAAVATVDQSSVGKPISIGANKPIAYTKDADFTGATPTANLNKTANYVCPTEVFIGAQQVFYANPAKLVDGEIMVPYNDIKADLGVNPGTDLSVEIDGVAYISASNLKLLGAAKNVDSSTGALVITPNRPIGNILVDKGGEAPEFVEIQPHKIYISAKDGVYSLKMTENDTSAGMGTMIDDEIRKFGVGTYKLTFNATGNTDGNVMARYFSYLHQPLELNKQDFAVTTSTTNCSFTFTVNQSDLDNNGILILAIYIKSGQSLKNVDIKDITLVKVA